MFHEKRHLSSGAARRLSLRRGPSDGQRGRSSGRRLARKSKAWFAKAPGAIGRARAQTVHASRGWGGLEKDLFGTQISKQTGQVPWDNTREWDKIPCQCGANSVLSQWQFQTFWEDPPKKTQLNYQCTKVPKTSDCVFLQTDSALDENGNLKNLEQLKVVCPDDKLLTGYKYVHKIPILLKQRILRLGKLNINVAPLASKSRLIHILKSRHPFLRVCVRALLW